MILNNLSWHLLSSACTDPWFQRTRVLSDSVSDDIDLDELIDSASEVAQSFPEDAAPSKTVGMPIMANDSALFSEVFLQQCLMPHCERAAISGFYRRIPSRRTPYGWAPLMDFVVVPRGASSPEFDWQTSPLFTFLLRYQLLCRGGGVPLRKSFSAAIGLYCYSFISIEGRVRIWVTSPESFGIVLLLTTGPQEHLGALSLRARRLGHSALMPEGLLTRNHQIVRAEETEIYGTLNLDWIPPQRRYGTLEA